MNDCEKYHALIVGLLDNELTPEETHELNTHLNRCEHCRKEFDEMKEISGKFSLPSFREPEDEVLEQLWKAPYSRFTRNAAIVMVLGGYLCLMGYGFYEFMFSSKEAAIPKVALAALVIGFLILLFSVIRERIKTYQKDVYKEVKR
jgi:anti-sigma factor RsiW